MQTSPHSFWRPRLQKEKEEENTFPRGAHITLDMGSQLISVRKNHGYNIQDHIDDEGSLVFVSKTYKLSLFMSKQSEKYKLK